MDGFAHPDTYAYGNGRDRGANGTRGSGNRRARSRSPDRYRGGRGFHPSKPVDPYTIDEVVSFAYFSNWYQTLNPTIDEPDTLRARYDDYLLDILSRTSRAFIEEQSQYAYFLERYMPKDTPKSMKQEAYDIFMSELSAGEMDHFTIDAPEGEIGLGMDERIQDSSLMAGEPSSKVVLIKSIPPKLPRTALETFITSQAPAKYISVSTPNARLLRLGWIVLQDGADIESVIKTLDGRILADPSFGEFMLHIGHHKLPSSIQKKRMLWKELGAPERIEQMLNQLSKVIKILDERLGKGSAWETISAKAGEVTTLAEAELKKRKLDFGIEYLRKVHSYDFFMVQEFDSLYDLQLHSPGYLRADPSAPPTNTAEAFEIWNHTFNQKMDMFLAPEELLLKMNVKRADEKIEETIMSHIKKEEDNKFRCQVESCTKLFKDIPFVRKHIDKRHTEWLTAITRQAHLTASYLVDPNKILPYKEFKEKLPSPRRVSMSRPRSPTRARGAYEPVPRAYDRPPPVRIYKDLDAPQEDLPDLDY